MAQSRDRTQNVLFSVESWNVKQQMSRETTNGIIKSLTKKRKKWGNYIKVKILLAITIRLLPVLQVILIEIGLTDNSRKYTNWIGSNYHVISLLMIKLSVVVIKVEL